MELDSKEAAAGAVLEGEGVGVMAQSRPIQATGARAVRVGVILMLGLAVMIGYSGLGLGAQVV